MRADWHSMKASESEEEFKYQLNHAPPKERAKVLEDHETNKADQLLDMQLEDL